MVLTRRWTRLRYHSGQWALWHSESRYAVIEVARRSGKSEVAKRKGSKMAIKAPPHIDDYRVIFCAPTRDQAKAIYWDDVKALIPPELVERTMETELSIRLKNGARIEVVGMDKPARVEGRPIDFAFIDEYADMKPGVWERHIRPALDTDGRPGKAWIYGVPRPSPDFKRRYDQAVDPEQTDWEYFTWTAASLLDPEVVEAARRDLDELTFAQEYEAKRVNLSGLAYYPWSRPLHAACRVPYDNTRTLIVALDFNVEPGVAVLAQEMPKPEGAPEQCAAHITGIVGEVYIPRNSTTEAVCRRIAAEYGAHKGEVHLHGDATGGARGTAQVEGSDWDVARAVLRPVFGDRLRFRVGRSNPPERARVNAMNSRLRSADGTLHVLVDARLRWLSEDFESVILLEGGSGELDKKATPAHTHLTDALGYYVYDKHPISDRATSVQDF